MRKAISLISLLSLFGAGIALVPSAAQAECTTSFHHYDVPDPTRRGIFISHFDGAGAPQSIVTTSDTDTTCTVHEEVPNGTTEDQDSPIL